MSVAKKGDGDGMMVGQVSDLRDDQKAGSGAEHYEADGRLLNFLAPIFPFSFEGDKEGKEDQLQVEAKGLFADVKEVIPKLLAARRITRKVHLSDAGQAWGDD